MLTCASTDKYRPLQKHIMQKLMELSLTEERMTISIDFGSSNEQKITAEDVLLGAYDIISRVFSQEQVIRAYRNTDPSTMDLRTSPESPEDVAEKQGNDELAK